MAKLKMGFIGLGSMGGLLASRLAPVGDLSVFDLDDAKMQPFEGRATLGMSIADVGVDADVVGICVRNDVQVEECLDALLPVMKSGSVLMIHSTISPDTVRAAAKRGVSSGIAVIDTPVTRTRYDEEDVPFVLSMTGGEKEITDRVRPLLDAYSTDSIHVGPLGSAMSLKIINNLVTMVEIMVAEEAFRLAAMNAVPAETLQAVMKQNGAYTPAMVGIVKRSGEGPPERAEQIQREVQASNGVKDLTLAEGLARSANTASACATFAKSQYWFAMTAHGPTGAW